MTMIFPKLGKNVAQFRHERRRWSGRKPGQLRAQKYIAKSQRDLGANEGWHRDERLNAIKSTSEIDRICTLTYNWLHRKEQQGPNPASAAAYPAIPPLPSSALLRSGNSKHRTPGKKSQQEVPWKINKKYPKKRITESVRRRPSASYSTCNIYTLVKDLQWSMGGTKPNWVQPNKNLRWCYWTVLNLVSARIFYKWEVVHGGSQWNYR